MAQPQSSRGRSPSRLHHCGSIPMPHLGVVLLLLPSLATAFLLSPTVVQRPPIYPLPLLAAAPSSFLLPPIVVQRRSIHPLPLLAAASSSTQQQQTPAQSVQHALTPEDILSRAFEGLPNLKAAHLSTAVLRLGKGLLQPKEAARRRQLTQDNKAFHTLLDQTLTLVSTPTANLGHVQDLLLGLALLEHPLHDEPALQARIEKVLYHNILARRVDELSPGDISGLAWCWHKLGFERTHLPSALAEVTAILPFRVLIGALKTNKEDEDEDEASLLDLEGLRAEVDLKRDTIQLSPDKTIEESRLTAWQGTQPFYYSGKEMPARPMTPRIAQIRDKLEKLTGVRYDCVLINMYETGKTGMRYHVDPDQGVYWSTNTVVVSIGDTREFCLREVEEEGEEEEANSNSSTSSSSNGRSKTVKKKKGKQSSHHRFFVAQSDATEMTRECQWKYQHAVKVCDNSDDAGPRMSLVYKQSLGQATEAEREWVASYLKQREGRKKRV